MKEVKNLEIQTFPLVFFYSQTYPEHHKKQFHISPYFTKFYRNFVINILPKKLSVQRKYISKSHGKSFVIDIFCPTYLIVGCAVPSGVQECEMEEPEPENLLYKSDLNPGFGFLNQRWSKLGREDFGPRSAGLDRSETPYLGAPLQGNKHKAQV